MPIKQNFTYLIQVMLKEQ